MSSSWVDGRDRVPRLAVHYRKYQDKPPLKRRGDEHPMDTGRVKCTCGNSAPARDMEGWVHHWDTGWQCPTHAAEYERKLKEATSEQ